MTFDLLPANFQAFVGQYLAPYRWNPEYWTARATAYVSGQILPGARKSMQPMAARLSAIPYDVIQQFITDSPWDWESIQLQTVDQVRDQVAGEDGLVNIDDTAFVKAGEHSVGVARQYCGQLGKVANCQAAVACVYVRQHPKRSADADTLNDFEEFMNGSDPRSGDTDGDGMRAAERTQRAGGSPTWPKALLGL